MLSWEPLNTSEAPVEKEKVFFPEPRSAVIKRVEALKFPEAIRVALNQEHAHHSEKIAGVREIGIFPPMTGG